jgi:hypothetical protein
MGDKKPTTTTATTTTNTQLVKRRFISQKVKISYEQIDGLLSLR